MGPDEVVPGMALGGWVPRDRRCGRVSATHEVRGTRP
jgi:hypothetical protein